MQLILSLIKGMGIREIVKYLQKNGYKVVRFTGTEINKDVSGFVSDVMELVEKENS